MVLRHSESHQQSLVFQPFSPRQSRRRLVKWKENTETINCCIFSPSKGYSAYLLLIILTQGQNYNIVMLNCNKQCPL